MNLGENDRKGKELHNRTNCDEVVNKIFCKFPFSRLRISSRAYEFHLLYVASVVVQIVSLGIVYLGIIRRIGALHIVLCIFIAFFSFRFTLPFFFFIRRTIVRFGTVAPRTLLKIGVRRRGLRLNSAR